MTDGVIEGRVHGGSGGGGGEVWHQSREGTGIKYPSFSLLSYSSLLLVPPTGEFNLKLTGSAAQVTYPIEISLLGQENKVEKA